ncbi:cyclic pyranopterin phosphate synthase [Mycetocola sp. CAN_C7]|uniref:GTP 3',8-cyclase MoaA n=1 Tax=Mycetocola sp. CAN_C7 TaxID=2787724 RepID=UPI0018CB3A5E
MTVALGIPRTRQSAVITDAATLPADRPRTDALVDRFGRAATDLRISLTDKCNLRCTYCMPAEGLPSQPVDALMTADEIRRLVGIAVTTLGVRQVRFTGGEPLLRADLIDIVSACASLPNRPEISLTTNAIGLGSRAGKLAAARLDRLNISLDSLHPDVFALLTRRPFLQRVLDGITAAGDAGFASIKINAVLVRGVNDDQAVELLDWSLRSGHQLRFIEQMPLDADHSWTRDGMVTAAQIRQILSEGFDLTPDSAPRDGAPAELWQVRRPGSDLLLGFVGIIASVTEPFCDDCRRTRLTAEGGVRSCLFSNDETDLLGPMRAGADDETLARLWQGEMWRKTAGHQVNSPDFVQPERTMSAIGG